ncbi:MAG: universal stress protein, partial [Syntrophaceae bacterium]|nr:universal stress protein [Syntrophaceae bacterium]
AFDGKIYVITSMVGGITLRDEDIEEAKAELKKAIDIIKQDGISCEEHLLVRGDEPGEDIVQFAEENNIDEIIIGVVKKSKVDKFFFGSNAQYVILHAPCPVIAVK